MRCFQKMTFGVSLLVSMALVGCGGAGQTDSAATKGGAAPSAAHDHSHGDEHGHEHAHEDEHSHDHEHAPHGGTIVDWGGGKFHVEFTVDHPTQKAVVYLLGSDAQSASPVAAKTVLLSLGDPVVQVELKPSPLEGETAERCSRFEGQHEALGTVREFAGTLSGEIDGVPYAADFAEEAHTH